ncbi:hypothetical protein H072_2028 [Dactylellina haptotyla CBS 200.50]|uniref:B30.2/SPRY domain-containing protein n=1 Tax=Dactylellina haptotyla (strain CBS 200.50) TaxID=1284197 RepID=S8BWS8_DACHA|nr:hypothetical protein H072_2028 [Dactylellina haptotyla CBS 200.50]
MPVANFALNKGLKLDTQFRERKLSNASVATPLNTAFPGSLRVTSKEQDSQCWLEAKVRFRDRILKSKHPPSQDNLNDFLRNNVNVSKAISEAERLKAKADRRYEGSLGKLLGVLSVLKDVGDAVLTCAPETVSIAWGIISLLVGIGTNDMDNCGRISEASTNIVTIILNCRLYENRHNQNEGKVETNELAERVMESIRELIAVVLEFFWHANRKFREDNKLKKFVDIFSIRSTANEKYETIITQYKELRTIARVEFEDNVLGWLHELKRDNAKLAEHLQSGNEELLRSLLLPELHEIKNKLDLVHADVSEIKVDVKEVAQELVMFRDETTMRVVEERTREIFQRYRAELSKSDVHIRQLTLTLGPLKRRLGTKHLARWLFTHQHYTSWETGDQKILYLKGQPGFGKSVAMAVAIERLMEKVSEIGADKSGYKYQMLSPTVLENSLPLKFSGSPILYFFFKRGDDETQLTKNAIASLLAQLFHIDHASNLEDMLRLMDALVNAVHRRLEKPEKKDGDKDKDKEKDKDGDKKDEPEVDVKSQFHPSSTKGILEQKLGSHDPVQADLARLEEIAKVMGKTIYIVIDGIDECTDYESEGLVKGLLNLGRSDDADFKILMSSRDITGLEALLLSTEETTPPKDEEKAEGADASDATADTSADIPTAEKPTDAPADAIPPAETDGTADSSDTVQCEIHKDTTIMTVNKSTNREDMRAYLEDSLTDLLDYKSNDMLSFANKEPHQEMQLSRKQARQIESMIQSIQKKADGMFTYSAMVVASLRQPSELSIKRRVRELPDQMDSLYAKHLDSLTISQRKLVVLALNRIVWAPQDMNTLEIVEQFKRVYLGAENNADGKEYETSDDEATYEVEAPSKRPAHLQRTESFIKGPDEDPMERSMRNPETIYTIRHLEAAGREFFKFSDGKRTINVIHKSVRDWVEKESRKAEERNLLPSTNILEWGDYGEIKVTIPRLFVEGNSASTGFQSEKDTLLDTFIYALEVLTSKRFHERYFPESLRTPEDAADETEGAAEVAEENPPAKEPEKNSTPEESAPEAAGVPSSSQNQDSIPQTTAEIIAEITADIIVETGTDATADEGNTTKGETTASEENATGVGSGSGEDGKLAGLAGDGTAKEPDTVTETIAEVTVEIIGTPGPLLQTQDGVENKPEPPNNNEEEDTKTKLGEGGTKEETERAEEVPAPVEENTEGDKEKSEPKSPKSDYKKNWKIRGEISHFDFYMRQVGTLWPTKERQGRKWNKVRDLLRKLTSKETWRIISPHFTEAFNTDTRTTFPADVILSPGLVAAEHIWEVYLEFLIEDEETNYDWNKVVFSPTDNRNIMHIPKLYFYPEIFEKIIQKLKPVLTTPDASGAEPFHQCLRRLSPSFGFPKETKQKLLKTCAMLLELDPKPNLKQLMPAYNDVPLCYTFWFTEDKDISLFYRIFERYKDDPEKFAVDFASAKGRTPLHSVWSYPATMPQDLQIEVAKKLMDAGADVNAQDIDSCGALSYAALNLNVKGVQMLVDAGADLNDDDTEGFTALSGVATTEDVEGMTKEEQDNAVVEIIKILANAGADLNIRTKKGQSALVGAIIFEKWEAAKTLVEMHAKQTDDYSYMLQLNAQRGSLLHMAINKTTSGPKIIDFVMEHIGKSLIPDFLAIRDFKDRTALEYGLTESHESAICLMGYYYNAYIDSGKDEKLAPNGYWMPRDTTIAALSDIKLLRLLRTDPYKETYERFTSMQPYRDWLLRIATVLHEPEMMEELSKAGVDPLHVDKAGWDIFDWGYACGSGDLLEKYFPKEFKTVDFGPRKLNWKDRYHPVTSLDLRHEAIEFSDDGVTFKVDKSYEFQYDYERASMVSEYPIPPYMPLFYYEVTVEELEGPEESSFVGVGLASDEPNLRKMPGWDDAVRRTFAMHSDDCDRVYSPDCFNSDNRQYRSSSCPQNSYSVGDTVGCGFDQINHTIFWTLNGKYWGVEFTDVKDRLYPMVGGQRCKARLNFGTDPAVPFVWQRDYGDKPPPIIPE